MCECEFSVGVGKKNFVWSLRSSMLPYMIPKNSFHFNLLNSTPTILLSPLFTPLPLRIFFTSLLPIQTLDCFIMIVNDAKCIFLVWIQLTRQSEFVSF